MFFVSDLCSEKTPVILVLPNCSSVFTPNKDCAPLINELFSGIFIFPTSNF